jgi:hypothetical protein
MSVTPAAAFGLKAYDPGALTLKRILIVRLLFAAKPEAIRDLK